MGVIVLLMVGILVRSRHLSKEGIVKGGSARTTGVTPVERESEGVLQPGVVRRICLSRPMVSEPLSAHAIAFVGTTKKTAATEWQQF